MSPPVRAPGYMTSILLGSLGSLAASNTADQDVHVVCSRNPRERLAEDPFRIRTE